MTFALSVSVGLFLVCLSSIGSSSKKTKDKCVKRSQSQRPAGHQDRGPPNLTAVSSPAEGEARVGDDAALKASLTDHKSQPGPEGESKATNIHETSFVPAFACDDLSPSRGSSSERQHETRHGREVIQTSAELGSDPLREIPSPPVTQTKNEPLPDEDVGFGLEPVSASNRPAAPKEQTESRELAEGSDKRNQTSDAINR